MCIIAIKPRNKKLQSKETLQTCFQRNSDGAGYMFSNNGKVIIKKGFMTFNDLYTALIADYNKYQLDNKNLVIHFRIGTSGKSKQGCTHPFPVSAKYEDLEQLHVITNIGVCHNGIISQMNNSFDNYSDTQKYISLVITPLIRLNVQSYKFKDIQEMILQTTHSKWAILNAFDEVYTVGQFVEDDGYYYSNTTYKVLPIVKYTTPIGYYDDYPEDDLMAHSSWYEKVYGNTLLKPKQEVKYNMLNKGNIILSKDVEYREIEYDNQYFFDAQYTIYKKHKKQYNIVTKNATIYSDDTFSQRRGFNNV